MHPSKVFDFFANDGDAALVGGVEFEDAGFEHFGAVELFGEGEDGGGLAGSRRPVEEHVGELESSCQRFGLLLFDDQLRTLVACSVRCRTVIVWSWAVTSFKLLGRLSKYRWSVH